MLYDFNSINHPNLMGARRSCGQYLHINLSISTDLKYLIVSFDVQLELLFGLSGVFTIMCMCNFTPQFYFGHKSCKSFKASIQPKSSDYIISYPTTNPNHPP
jgi:hypothetical protein